MSQILALLDQRDKSIPPSDIIVNPKNNGGNNNHCMIVTN